MTPVQCCRMCRQLGCAAQPLSPSSWQYSGTEPPRAIPGNSEMISRMKHVSCSSLRCSACATKQCNFVGSAGQLSCQ